MTCHRVHITVAGSVGEGAREREYGQWLLSLQSLTGELESSHRLPLGRSVRLFQTVSGGEDGLLSSRLARRDTGNPQKQDHPFDWNRSFFTLRTDKIKEIIVAV